MALTPLSDDEAARWSAPFRYRDYNLYEGSRVLADLAVQAQGVAVGWQVFALTHRPLDLAWVGAAQFVPGLVLALFAGQAADRFERRRILLVCHAAMAALSAALAFVTLAALDDDVRLASIYAILVGVGVVRAFLGTAGQSIVPTLVPENVFPRAVAWESTLWQGAMFAGPLLGGVAYAASGASLSYACASVAFACGFVLLALMRRTKRPPAVVDAKREGALASLLAGVRYVKRAPIVLGCISLDLFAVLLGGATALLPVYAKDILHAGPWALGLLRGSPAVGAAAMGLFLALRPLGARAGPKMLVAVALFGVATIVFGVSRSLSLSIGALVVAGAADMVSVVVRASLVQLATPDAMRGRVSAVNSVFIGASNELGEVESGVAAQLLGAVPAVVLGGAGTIIVVLIWAIAFRSIRNVDRLHDVKPAA